MKIFTPTFKISLKVFVIVLISFFAVSCIQSEKSEARDEKIAEDFRLEDLSQNVFKLSDYKHKQPVVLFFWTTWCRFCRRDIRKLNDIYSDLAKEGAELLSINVGESRYKVDRFIKNHSPLYKVLLDEDTRVAYSYNVLGIPTYVVIDKKGYVVYKGNYFPSRKFKQLISE